VHKLQESLKAQQVDTMVFHGVSAQVMKNIHVEHGANIVVPEDLFGSVSLELEAKMLHVTREPRRLSAVDAYHPIFSM